MKLLITYPHPKFRNLKWSIQYGSRQYKKLLHLNETEYLEVYEVTDYESELNKQV